MSISSKIAKSFTIDRDIDQYVISTRGERSASERVNEMLTNAMKQEQYARLEAEAEAYFASLKNRDRRGTRAFQTAAIRAITRD
jgi:hypothetical protein